MSLGQLNGDLHANDPLQATTNPLAAITFQLQTRQANHASPYVVSGEIAAARAHLRAPGFAVAPVGDVADVDHEGDVHHRVPQHAGGEAARVLPQQVARQEAAVGAAHCRHSSLIHITCARRDGPQNRIFKRATDDRK